MSEITAALTFPNSCCTVTLFEWGEVRVLSGPVKGYSQSQSVPCVRVGSPCEKDAKAVRGSSVGWDVLKCSASARAAVYGAASHLSARVVKAGIMTSARLRMPGPNEEDWRSLNHSALALPQNFAAGIRNKGFVWGCREIIELFPGGLGIHHAGMLRKHRTLMERAFEKGYIKVCSVICALLPSAPTCLQTTLRGVPSPCRSLRILDPCGLH